LMTERKTRRISCCLSESLGMVFLFYGVDELSFRLEQGPPAVSDSP